MLKKERLRICRTDRFAPLNLSYINKMSNKKIKSTKQGHEDGEFLLIQIVRIAKERKNKIKL